MPVADPTFPGGQETLGQPMYPWLMRWNSPHAAPTSGYENQALGDMSNYASQGFGLGGSRDYLNSVMGGQWLNQNNPYFDQIESSGKNLLQGQQHDALKELQSRAAAGGNALGGALLSSEGRYLNDSNASFDEMMARLRAAQYGQERGYMNQAPGQMNQLAQTEMGGLGQLMNMGAVPREVQNQEIQGQYNDWLRQINSLRDQNRYPDQMAQSFLNSNRYPGYQQPQYGNSTADQLIPLLAMLLGGGGQNGVGAQLGTAAGNALGNLLGNNKDPNAPTQYTYAPTNPYGDLTNYYPPGDPNAPMQGPQQPTDYQSILDQYYPQYMDQYNYDPYANQSPFDPSTFDYTGQ